MSAAAPPPPPNHTSGILPINGYLGHKASAPSSKSALNNGIAFGSDGAGSTRQRQPLPRLQDLAQRANTQYNSSAPIGELLQKAGALLKAADSSLEFGRQDYAYTEYIAAYTIIATVVPQHPDSRMLKDSRMLLGRQPLYEVHRKLIIEVNAREAKYGALRELILEDNRRHGTQNATAPQSSSLTNASEDSNSLPVPKDLINSPLGTFTKVKPLVQPKPQNLHGAVVSSNLQRAQVPSSGGDSLTARFARLRTADGTSGPDAISHDSDQRHEDSTSWTLGLTKTNLSSSPRSSRSSTPAFTNAIANSARLSGSSNLLGGIGTSPRGGLSITPYLEKDLPKPPSPTYSPSRSLQDGSPIRSTRNTIMNTGGSATSINSTSSLTYEPVSDNYMNTVAIKPHHGITPHTSRPVVQPRRKSLNVPQETDISAERLHDYLKRYNILLIDVRSREAYDSGHIFNRTSICIEPTALRLNMSAEELQDALVISPEAEFALFDQRDQFDLVVYYDQSSSSKSTTNRSLGNPSLKYIHDALYEFNQEKPLLYPPLFMKGGMTAWVDLLGEQALQTSNTAARVKTGRPLARRPPATTMLSVQKRRRYNPLAPDEEERWRERARSETVVLDAQPQVHEIAEEAYEEDVEAEPYPRNYDEFHRRFPDVATVERQSMMIPIPQRAPPEPPRIPTYPTPPPPTVPSRPAPIVQRPSYSGVSERAMAQNLPAAKPQELAQYIPQKLKRLPRTGLHNFGATCYMNATIQCLSASIPLTAFFLDGRFDNFIQKDNWKGSKGIMPELYTNLLRALWLPNGVDTIRPTNFRKLCARLNREWASERQQDAKEFLEFLVDCLHEDLNVNWSRNPLRELTLAQEVERERTPPFIAAQKEWARYEHRDHSRLTDLFAGQHISRLQCTTCHHSSTTYEAFYSISVEIPAPPRSQQLTLDDCLRSYCAAEMLSGDEVWRCPHCRAEREATKRITISRAPEFLVIHLKRFSASHSERARKIHTPVEFPLQNFDLEPYMLPPLSRDPAQREAIAKGYGREQLEAPRSMQPPYRYDCYAVMRHLGASMTSGHYVGLVRDAARGCWREFNDERIVDFRPEELPRERRLQNEMAYIVFYQRVAV